MNRLAFKLALFVLAFMAIAAPGGGGGGGGVGGGGGGFGGGYYGGGLTGFRGSPPSGGPTDWGILGIVLGGTGVAALAGWCLLNRNKGQLLEVVFVTKNGFEVASKLDELLNKANFNFPMSRAEIMAKVAAILEPNLVDGWVQTIGHFPKFPSSDAETAYGYRIGQLHLRSGRVAKDRKKGASDDACLVGLLFTNRSFRSGIRGGFDEAKKKLRTLGGPLHARSLDTAYIYYSPEPDQTLSMEKALAELKRLPDLPVVAPPHVDDHLLDV